MWCEWLRCFCYVNKHVVCWGNEFSVVQQIFWTFFNARIAHCIFTYLSVWGPTQKYVIWTHFAQSLNNVEKASVCAPLLQQAKERPNPHPPGGAVVLNTSATVTFWCADTESYNTSWSVKLLLRDSNLAVRCKNRFLKITARPELDRWRTSSH